MAQISINKNRRRFVENGHDTHHLFCAHFSIKAQEATEELNREPSIGTMGWGPYFIYIFILTFIHHFYLVLLEWLQFGNFTYFIGKVTATTLMSMLLILLPELITNRRKLKR